MRYAIALFLLLNALCSPGQSLSTGEYKGLETITVTPDKTAYWPGIYNFGSKSDSVEEKWYHGLLILVRNSFLTIEKRPLTIKDGLKSYSDSTGGYYSYKGTIVKVNDTTFNLHGYLVNCRYCPSLATATPRYVFASYVIHVRSNYWIVNTSSEKGLLFKKE